MLAHDTGVLSATTAFGKTVVAAWLIAERKVNTLVLVHRRQLQEQWVERLAAFLGLPAKAIGRIGGGAKSQPGLSTWRLSRAWCAKAWSATWSATTGISSSTSATTCPRKASSRSSAGRRRSSSRAYPRPSAARTAIIRSSSCSAGRFVIGWMRSAQAAARPFTHAVHVRPTGFRPAGSLAEDVRIQFQELYSELIADQERNQLIYEDVLEAVREGRSPLVLTERNEHLDDLAARFAGVIPHVIVLRGGMTKNETTAVTARLAAIPNDELRLLLATGRLIGEGFDDARLDTLFLTLPVSWHGTIAQYAGRLHRLYAGKREVRVMDYADLNVPMLARMFDRRCRGYEAVGYTILLPGSAIPGWPADVPLPVDPQWKKDYAASVRRLVRDGVDTPLANLFVHVARDVTPTDEGVARARSATEAFLFRRLETLPETVGRFRLNAELPIPFDGTGQMEVDLLCADARIAIELDGSQHFDDADAYRRDRRKDLLLQEHGYFVLRFLAVDVGRCLDMVLDAILRTLSHSEQNRRD